MAGHEPHREANGPQLQCPSFPEASSSRRSSTSASMPHCNESWVLPSKRGQRDHTVHGRAGPGHHFNTAKLQGSPSSTARPVILPNQFQLAPPLAQGCHLARLRGTTRASCAPQQRLVTFHRVAPFSPEANPHLDIPAERVEAGSSPPDGDLQQLRLAQRGQVCSQGCLRNLFLQARAKGPVL